MGGIEACKPVTTTILSSACPKCGIIKRSGKASCCGHGGSWFKNCGGAGNTNLDHTWYEGIKTCRARRQSRIAVGRQANAGQQKGNHSSHTSVSISTTPYDNGTTNSRVITATTSTVTPT